MQFLSSTGTLAGASCTSNYGAWQQALAEYQGSEMGALALGALALGDLGKAKKKRAGKEPKISIRKKRRVSDSSYKEALKYRVFKNEDRKLERAYKKKNLYKAKGTLLKLARIRDRLRRKANRKAGRRETKGRVRRMERVRKKAQAADTIMRYWKGKFADLSKAATDKAKKAEEAQASGEEVPEEYKLSEEEQALLAEAQQAGQQLDMLELPGFTDTLPPQPGEEEVSEALLAEMENDESEDFGTPFTDQEYGIDPGLGALALGHLGNLFS